MLLPLFILTLFTISNLSIAINYPLTATKVAILSCFTKYRGKKSQIISTFYGYK